MSSMTEWARQEVFRACRKENPEWNGYNFDYACSCYQSALKAYESLMQDGHSGMSFSITAQILQELLKEHPLTPINEVDFEGGWTYEFNGGTGTQCPRLPSLFKEVHSDGSISYSDNNRVIGASITGEHSHYKSKMITNIIDGMFPITMPYLPPNNPYKVYTDEFLVEPGNGDFDTIGVYHCITPHGEKVIIDRYFKEVNNKMVEIDRDEYDARKLLSKRA